MSPDIFCEDAFGLGLELEPPPLNGQAADALNGLALSADEKCRWCSPDPLPSLGFPPVLAPLISLCNWVIWKWEAVENGKRTKVPYRGLSPKRKAANNDPTTWCSYSLARRALSAGWADGVGFCLQGTDIVAFDIDGCRDKETGALHPWARKLVERAGSYCEVTPSGRGLRSSGAGAGRVCIASCLSPKASPASATVKPHATSP